MRNDTVNDAGGKDLKHHLFTDWQISRILL